MFSDTIAALEKFDNQHDFERMSADILNSLGYKNVVLIAPRGGSDGGKDIIFTTDGGLRGLACVTLRKDIATKFTEDFSKRKAGEFNIYILFCTSYLTASQKSKFTQYCLSTLQAEFVPEDIETLRSLLDTTMLPIREKYLRISSGLEGFSQKSKQQWFDDCEAYWADGAAEKALVASIKATAIDPFDWFGYYKTGWILEQLDRHQEALAFCEQGIQRDPTRCENIIYFVKADALFGLKRYNEALAIYKQLKQNEYKHGSPYTIQSYLEALCGEGNVLFELERYDEAFAIYETAIELGPINIIGYQNKGYSLYLLDRNEEAIAILEEAIKIAPNNAYSYRVLGNALYELKRFEEALAAYEKAIQLEPKDKYSYRRKGDTLKALNRPEEAQRAYEVVKEGGYSK